MITRSTLLIIVNVFLLSAFCAAKAASVDFVRTPNPGTNTVHISLAGTVTTDIVLATPDHSVLSQQMRLVLTRGRVVNHALGTNVPPSSDTIALFPELAYDSFVAAGQATAGIYSPQIVGRSDRFIGSPGPGVPPLFSDNVWDVLWGPTLGQPTFGSTNFLSARLTLTGDAEGTLGYRVGFADIHINISETFLPLIQVQNGKIGGDLPLLSVNPPGLGNTAANLGSPTVGALRMQTLLITNNAAQPLVLGTPVLSGPFSIVGSFPNSIPPNSSASFAVAVDTSAIGEKLGSMTFTSSGSVAGQYLINLSANVVPEPTGAVAAGLASFALLSYRVGRKQALRMRR